MLGNYFYHARIRKAVASFGSLFDSIYIVRQNSSGQTISQVKVPLSYGPKRNFIERIQQTYNGEEAERQVAIKLPRMSFQIDSIAFDSGRQLNKMNSTQQAAASGVTTRAKINQSVPYNITFSLSIYAKAQDDALQVVEQIIPTFNPKYTMSITPFSDYSSIKEDVPILVMLARILILDSRRRGRRYDMDSDKNVQDDYEYSRATYYDLIEKGRESLEDMIAVARESEHPRAYEVLSSMIKNISDVNDRLMDLNKKKKDIVAKEDPKAIGNTTNNLFIGSTTDLQRLLHNESDKVIDVTPDK